jgi:hypothetical protein
MGIIYTRAGSMSVTRYSTLLRHSSCVKLHRIMSPIGKCHAIITRKQEIGLNLQFSELSQPPPPAFYINILFISGICPSRDRRSTREQFRVADRQPRVRYSKTQRTLSSGPTFPSINFRTPSSWDQGYNRLS